MTHRHDHAGHGHRPADGRQYDRAFAIGIALNNVQAEFAKVTDMGKMMSYGILATPPLVINEEAVSSRIPTVADIQRRGDRYRQSQTPDAPRPGVA